MTQLVKVRWRYQRVTQLSDEAVTPERAQQIINDEIKEQAKHNEGRNFGTWDTVPVIEMSR